MAESAKKTKATAKPGKTPTKKTTVPVAKAASAIAPAREQIEQLAKEHWAARGGQDGYAEQDWLRAEQELRKKAS